MKIKRVAGFVAIFLIYIMCLGYNVLAEEPQFSHRLMGTEQFSFSILPHLVSKNSIGISLEEGETVTIKGSFTPFSASVEYGFSTDDDLFYGVTADDGIFDYTFTIGKEEYIIYCRQQLIRYGKREWVC